MADLDDSDDLTEEEKELLRNLEAQHEDKEELSAEEFKDNLEQELRELRRVIGECKEIRSALVKQRALVAKSKKPSEQVIAKKLARRIKELSGKIMGLTGKFEYLHNKFRRL